MSSQPVLRVQGLVKRYGPGCPHCPPGGPGDAGAPHCSACGTVHAVRGISLEVHPGEVLGVVGESGSGKSTLLRCLCFDEEATAGGAYLSGYEEGRAEVFSAPPHARRRIRNEMIGTVHQNPLLGLRMGYSSLANVAEKLIAAGSRRVEAMRGRSAGLLTHVRIPGDRLLEPPATFSGGMQQRVQIAKALAGQPVLLLLDEVTAGLDVSVQARVLDLLRALREELTAAMIFVSHDLRVVRMLADRTLVMRSGLVVEQGLTDQILEDPQHPCTQELVHAML